MDEKGTLDLKATINKHQELLMGKEEEDGEMQKVLRMHMEPLSSALQRNLSITTATIQCGNKCSCLGIIRLPISPPDYLSTGLSQFQTQHSSHLQSCWVSSSH